MIRPLVSICFRLTHLKSNKLTFNVVIAQQIQTASKKLSICWSMLQYQAIFSDISLILDGRPYKTVLKHDQRSKHEKAYAVGLPSVRRNDDRYLHWPSPVFNIKLPFLSEIFWTPTITRSIEKLFALSEAHQAMPSTRLLPNA